MWWLGNKDWSDYSDVDNEEEDNGSKMFILQDYIFDITGNEFAQDLQFQVTPNMATFQARYIITHPATGDLSCDAGKKYLAELKKRRREELENLNYLTGKDYNDWDVVKTNDSFLPKDVAYNTVALSLEKPGVGNQNIVFAAISLLGLGSLLKFGRRKKHS